MTTGTFASDRVGPSVVAVGGGHGLAATLRAARLYAGLVTAVVSVADDGGSSGRLRAERPDLPAPGDVRRCLSALADDHSSLGQVLEHRFGAEGPVGGHALGNLLLATLTTQLGSFPAAVDEVGRLVGAVGRVLPATVGPVTLVGEVGPARDTADDGQARTEVVGQVAVANTAGVTSVRIDPSDAASPPEVRAAILAADQVVLGPGSLFTSLLAAAVVPDVLDALAETTAQRVFVANLRPQVPETADFRLADYLGVLRAHGVPVDVVVAQIGTADRSDLPDPAPVVAEHDLVGDAGGTHHPERLAAALAGLLRSSAFPSVR